jgi:hypothetical protein
MDETMYFVDTRNADFRDHRVIRPTAIVPAGSVALAPAAAPSSRVYGPPAYSPPPAAMTYPAAYPSAFPPAQFFGPTPPVYAPGPIYGQPPFGGMFGGLFGGLNLGDVVKLAADAFAAFKSLPAQPAPTGDVATDVVNGVVYNAALAKDGTTRKQIEFGGQLAGRLGRGLLGGW